MDSAELRDFVESQRVMVISTLGPRGWPHSVPQWFTVRDEAGRQGGGVQNGDEAPCDFELWTWTYRGTQKVRNLERDSRATLMFEDGDGYEDMRGAILECRAELISNDDVCLAYGTEAARRYAGGEEPDDKKLESLAAQASKRTVIRFEVQRVASWDARKLEGAR